METRIEVGVLGATGMVGQHFVKFLQGHPWFDLKWLGASDRSAGKQYRNAMHWHLGVVPESVADLTVEECKPSNAPRLVFSAMDALVATEIEQAFARAGHVVVSNSKNHRMEPDVPLLVPEINPDHLNVIPAQQRRLGWNGQIVTNPNCATISLTMGLAAMKPFGIRRVIVTTMQAISGAGYPGVPSMDINANVIPFIGGEEEKMDRKPRRFWAISPETTSVRWMRASARTATGCRWWTAIPRRSLSSSATSRPAKTSGPHWIPFRPSPSSAICPARLAVQWFT